MAVVIRAVIFDMDGLMIDSEPLARIAWRETARRLGREIDESLFARMLGRRESECSAMVRDHWGLDMPAEDLAEMRNALFLASLPGRLRAMPGLYELLAELKARGLRKALATSGERQYVQTVIRELGLEGVFDAMVVAQDVARGKPAPDVYLLAAQRLDLGAGQCLVLEDAPNGMAAARAAGIRCVAVPNEFTQSLDLSAADVILPSLLDVRDCLDELLA